MGNRQAQRNLAAGGTGAIFQQPGDVTRDLYGNQISNTPRR